MNLKCDLLSRVKIAEIRKRCEIATLGPWHSIIEGRNVWGASNIISTPIEDIEIQSQFEVDQGFVAFARQAILYLLAEIDVMTEKLQRLEVRDHKFSPNLATTNDRTRSTLEEMEEQLNRLVEQYLQQIERQCVWRRGDRGTLKRKVHPARNDLL